MQYVYNKNAGDSLLTISDDIYKYLFRVRRHSLEEIIEFRNLIDDKLYSYQVVDISKKEATLKLLREVQDEDISQKKLHIGWMVIDPKNIEKTIPFLNEIGVSDISFIYGDYSQKNFKINIEKLEKITINSSSQCGRVKLINFQIFDSLDKFLDKYSNSYLFNFSDNLIDNEIKNIDTIVVGPEGGVSLRELKLFAQNKIVGINSKNILRSETATITVASKILV